MVSVATFSPPASTTPVPRQEYLRRLEDRERLRSALTRRERWLGLARLSVFFAALAMLWMTFAQHWFSPWWLLLPLALFSGLLVIHERVTRAWLSAGRAVAFYERGLARVEDRWTGTGQSGERFIDDTHPYSSDLDLFGKGSLFELLCTARTRTGEDTLAAWLRHPATTEEVRARQAAIAELRDLLDLREDLALLGAHVPVGVDFNAVIHWGMLPPLLVAPMARLLAFLLGALGMLSLLGWLLSDWPIALLVGVLWCEMALALVLRRRVLAVVSIVEKSARDLALLAGVLARIERETFASPRLQELRRALDQTGEVPSQRIAQLCNLIDLLNSRRNQMFAPFALLMMWTTQMAFAIETWRRRSGSAIGQWLEIVGQIEALCALATFAYENPENPFPEILEQGPTLEGEGLGHPLIPRDRCVRNDITLNPNRRLLVVSGSNMSGKSTMLRTVGINTVLAMAGGPVRAARLRVSPLMIGATLRIQDSLQAGRSRFYAELLRIKQVVDLSRREPTLLFLLDEIFHGTNSHDRRLGAQAIVRSLVAAGAIGMVTTHDLSLTHIVEELAPHAENVHFADHFENGVMVFDYRMQPGVVRNSNALALMRAVGLEV